VDGIREDSNLKAQEGSRRVAHLIQDESQERHRHLFSGRNEGIVFPPGRVGMCVFGHSNQTVRFSGHGGQDNDYAIPFFLGPNDFPRDVADLVKIGDGSPAVFLYDQTH
jgi:hypothetical protein